MNRLLALLALLLVTIITFAIHPAFAADSAVVAAGGFHIDFTPLIPVINGLIVAVAGVLSASVPVLVGLLAKWLYSHSVNLSQQNQKAISDRITTTIQNGLKFATSGADVGVSKLNITVQNDTVAKAANYAIAQSPDLLKKAGIDVTTEAGQQTLVRRITAESMPTPAALAPTTTTNLTSDEPKQVGAEPDK